MKKILIFASILTVCACSINAGSTFWPTLFSIAPQEKTYNIDFFEDTGLKLVKTEKHNEIEPKANEINRVYTGFSVFYDKTYKKSYYQDCFVKAKMDGVLSSASLPSKVFKGDVKKLVGRAEIDDVWYSLLPSDQDEYVWLIKEDGSIYNRIGQVKDDELYIIDIDFVAHPKNLSFEIIKETKMTQTMPTTGYEIKYDGQNQGVVSFLVLDYSKYGKNKGNFEKLRFEYKENQNIEINDVKIKILFADKEKLDYIILDY